MYKMEGKRLLSPDNKLKRVGYWLTDKKIRRLNFEAFEKFCRLVCRCCFGVVKCIAVEALRHATGLTLRIAVLL